jgi:anti-sigma-K factor RskA
MRDERDQELDALFALARRETPYTEAMEAHFEARFIARLNERKNQMAPWQQLIWRMIPAFAAIAVVMLICSITINPDRSSDPFAAITNGYEDQMAKNYLWGDAR